MIGGPKNFALRLLLIVVFLGVRSRPRGSSVAMEIRVAHVWTMRDGKAARCELFPVREEALEAVGLRE